MNKNSKLIIIIIAVLLVIAATSIILLLPIFKESQDNNRPTETQPAQTHSHIWSEWITEKDATCSEKGLNSRTCECGEKDEMVLSKLDHKFSEWSVTTEAQCEIEGVKERLCSSCNYKETQSITALTHTEGDWIIKNNEKHFLCTYCKKSLRFEKLATSDGLTINNKTVVSIGKCTDIEIVIPHIIGNDSVTIIGEQAFEYENITSIILPDTITTIKSSAFYQCSKLEIVHLGNNLLTIENKAFYKCSSLKSISLTKSLTTLGASTFAYCSNLETVYIENSIEKFEMRVFQDCKKLSDIYFNGTIEEWNAIKKDKEWDLGTGQYTIHCTNGDIEK